MNLRPFPLAVGAGATALAVGLVAAGEPALPSGTVSDLPLIAVSVIAGAVAVLAFLVRSLDGERGPRLPDTDSQHAAVPGDDLDTAMAAGRGRETVRDRVRAVGVSVLEREGRSRDDARATLEDGSWTDDGDARALLDGTPISALARLSGWLTGSRPFRRRVAHATAELLRRDER
ncbi:DUF7269 family protein [Haloarcula nitratireducens]|uniref:Uncharacterized protein n=1 Tax=Haloarcula nitratireducens TaxID=2487749 RepID=A0AAW4PDU5_9EURY|nr:hypothetical protein [Halomicroarcula nitratireducens]MBX0296003.1 hypothetical protein [Halomicroarcula nitratireducens]